MGKLQSVAILMLLMAYGTLFCAWMVVEVLHLELATEQRK